ncbi:SSI family serine proteinase inhibitor [Allokutzneria oryzae]|uniref:SSI family serine proteinase inhibitor n=1 Tax=Allokutzneria oryzae TaxID=1378989 RepID=A0ABV6AA35_9PSEU
MLVLSSNPGETVSPRARRVVLTCSPAGGTHPAPRPTCTELSKVGGDVTALNINPNTACPLIYDPITVTSTGFWKGRPMRQRMTFPNSCVLTALTGPVFRF